MEDLFVEKYGKDLEIALEVVHEEYCSDSDVLLPIAYVAKKYIKKIQRATLYMMSAMKMAYG